MKNYIYIVPIKNFFSNTPGGRVTHALGIVNGLSNNNCNVLIISESGIDRFRERINSKIKVKTLSKSFFFLSALKESVCSLRQKNTNILIRKSPVFLLFLIPFLIFKRKSNHITIEVNGFGFDVRRIIFKRPIVFLSQVLTRIILFPFSSVYAVNTFLKRKMTSGFFSISSKRVFVVNNAGPNPTKIDWKNKKNNLSIIFYGIFHQGNDLELISKSVETLNQKENTNIVFEIYGFGYQEDEVVNLSKKYKSTILYGKADPKEFVQIMKKNKNKCIGVIPLHGAYGVGEYYPIKAFEYMSFGMPILYSNMSMDGLLKDEKDGKMYIDGNLESCINSLAWFNQNISRYDIFSENIIDIYKNHTWESAMKKYCNEIKNLINND